GATLYTATNVLTNLGTTTLGTGVLNLVDAGGLTVTGVVGATGGVTLNTSGALAINNTVTATGAIVALTTTGAGNAITQSGTGVITASDLTLATVNASATLNTAINALTNLGTTTLGTGVLNLLDAGGLTITGVVGATGGVTLNTSGMLAVNDTVNASGATVDINASGASEGGTSIITAANLRLQGTGTFTLSHGNAAGTLAANVIGAFSFTNAGALSVGSVLGTNGVTSTDFAIAIATQNGALSITNTGATNDVNAGTSAVSLTAGSTGNDNTLTIVGTGSDSALVTGSGGVTLSADRLSVQTTATTVLAVDAGAGTVTVLPSETTTAINLGSTVDTTAATLEVSNAELGHLKGGVVKLGDASITGNLTVSAAIAPPALNATTLSLEIGGTGTIVQSGSGAITVASLALRSGSGVINLATNANNVTALSADSTSGTIIYRDSNAFTVGVVDGLNGISTTGDIGLTAVAGLITMTNGVKAIGGTLTLTASQGVNQTGGAAVSDKLLLLGGTGNGNSLPTFSFTLNQTLNDWNTVAAAVLANINLNDMNDMTVGIVGSTFGITTGDTDNAGGNVVIRSHDGLTMTANLPNTTIDTRGKNKSGGIIKIGAGVTPSDGGNTDYYWAGKGNIDLDGGGLDLVILVSTPANSPITYIAPRDIIVRTTLQTLPGSGFGITLTADSDNDGLGGVWIDSSGKIDSDTDVLITGSDVFRTIALPGDRFTGIVANDATVLTFARAAIDWSGTTNDWITLTGHGLLTGDAVIYDNGSGSSITNLTDGNTYYAIVVNVNQIRLATTRANALANTKIDLGSSGGADDQKFSKRVVVGATTAIDSVRIDEDNLSAVDTDPQITAKGSVTLQHSDISTRPELDQAVIVVNGIVRSNTDSTVGGSDLTILARRDIRFGADGDLASNGGDILLSAGRDAAGNEISNGAVIVMVDDTQFNAGTGSISASAAGNIELGALVTTHADTPGIDFTFNPAVAVNDPADTITLSGPLLTTGDKLIYTNGGGTNVGGLVNGTAYYVIQLGGNMIQLAATQADAVATTKVPLPLNLTGTTGSSHTLDRTAAVTLTNRPLGGGAIVDAGDSAVNVTADSGTLVIRSVTGFSKTTAADAYLETSVAALDIVNSTSGNILVAESTGLTIVQAQQTLAGNIQVVTTNGPITVGHASTPSNAVSVTGANTIAITAGGSTSDIVTVASTGDIVSATGSITLTAGRAVTLNDRVQTTNSAVNVTTGSGDTGLLTLTTGGATSGSIASGGGAITITADNVSLDNPAPTAINATGGTVTIQNVSANRPLDLGTDTVGNLALTDAELDTITAGKLVLGSGTAGAITVSQDIALTDTPTIATLRLNTGSTVTGIAGGLVVSDLAINAAGAVNISDRTNVSNLAIFTTTGAITFAEANGFNVTTVDGINGVDTNAGAVSLTATTGNLTVTNTSAANDIDATASITLTLNGNDALFTLSSGADVETTGGGVTVSADKMNLVGTVTASGQTVTLQNSVGADALNLGSGTDAAANTLELSDTELDQITASKLILGSGTAGAIMVSADIDLTDTPTIATLRLNTGSTVTGTAGGLLVSNLAIQAAGAVNVTDSTTNVTNLAIYTSSGAITFTEANGFSVAAVDGINGVDTDSGTVSLSVTTGNLTVTNTSAANDIDATGLITLTLNGNDAMFAISSGADVETTGGGVTVSADKMNLVGIVTASGQTVTLRNSVGADSLNLGSATDAAANTLELSDTELDLITASKLVLGSGTAGAITISADIDLTDTPTITTLRLNTGSTVTGTAGGLVVSDLAINAAGTVNITDSTTNVTNLAIFTSTGAITFTEANGFIVAAVDGIDGVDTNSGAVSLTATTGNLTITNTSAANDIDATGLITILLSGNDALFTISASGDMETTSGGVTVNADKMDVVGTITASGQTVTLRNSAGADALDLGSTTDAAANTLELSGAELDQITAGKLVLGSGTAGAVTVSQAINPAGTTLVHLFTGAGVSGPGSIEESDLAVTAASDVTINTLVGNLAVTTSSGSVMVNEFAAGNSLTITSVDGVEGITATNAIAVTVAAA
ncbi:MAG: hypothetical protein NTY19_03435, partial [Planctomycetota bacterium]|nr:hypothetical protein [Planctomycetota bacterium]